MTGVRRFHRGSEPSASGLIEERQTCVEVSLVMGSKAWCFVKQLNLGEQITHTVSPPQDVREWETDTRISFVSPPLSRRIHKGDVKFPWSCAACPQPEIAARRRYRFCSKNERPECALVSGPDIQASTQVLAEQEDIAPRNAGIDVAVDPLLTGEGFDRPTSGNPPPAAIAAEEIDHVRHGAMTPRPIEADGLGVVHCAHDTRRR